MVAMPLSVARLWGAPIELLSNGGFERVKDGVPAGCSVQHPFASVEATAEARSGKTAALLRLPKSSESSWVYIDRVKNNPHYLQFIDDSLGSVREALERLRALGTLRGLLAGLDPTAFA